MRARRAEYPDGGTLRVNRDPRQFSGSTQLARTAERPGAKPEGNRFDDPLGEFMVRYTAESLRGCLVETMVRFRPDPGTEALLAAFDDVEENDVDHDREEGLAEWLVAQRIGVVRVHPEEVAVDIEAAETLVDLDKHREVRRVLDDSVLSTGVVPARLDAGVIRLQGPVGRPVTQAVSRALYEEIPQVGLFRYHSRLDPEELCWAIYDRCRARVDVLGPLDPAEPAHLAAVRSVGALFQMPLPAPWS